MPERIYKLQPDRTVQLRGFDTFAAAACVHSASPAGFKVSGTFRDPADFAVAVLYDADNFYEHPSIKYLPDFDFSGLSLSFNLCYTAGLQPIDSPKFNWIDWATLDCSRADGTTGQVHLWENSTLVDAAFPAATATCNVITSGAGVRAFDRVTLWYQNLAFDYIAPEGQSSFEFLFYATGTGNTHSMTVNGRTYSHVEIDPGGESSADQASALISAAAGDPDVSVSAGSAPNAVSLTVRPDRAGIAIPVSASDGGGSLLMRLTTPNLVAAALVSEINAGTDWALANATYALMAQQTGAQIQLTAARYGTVNVAGISVALASGHVFVGITPGCVILIAGLTYTVASVQSPSHLTLMTAAIAGTGATYVAPRGGHDGNLIHLYSTSNTATLSLDQTQITFAGGRSDVTWNCVIDFTARGIDSVRQCWLTFAPALLAGPYPATEWEAVFSNWRLTRLPGSATPLNLSIAGPGSVRLEQSDKACVFTPAASWTVETGFYSKYFAKATSDLAATVNATYTCQFPHDLYLGTSLYSDRAVAGVRVDNDPETHLDCRLTTSSAVVTRRRVRTNLAAGRHTVAISLQQAGFLYFNFLEAAVVSDIRDALTPRTNISPALDFDTDHTYKLSPSRLMWIMDQLGYAGPMNEYLGVFWWNERTLSGGSFSAATVGFTGAFAANDTVFLTINGEPLKKTIFPVDTNETIAIHFASYINGALVGAWATASAGILTLTSRSPATEYNLTVSTATTSLTGFAAVTQAPVPGVYGTWVIDDTVSQSLNRAARDWHADFYSQCATRGREVVTACSLELVNPPAGCVARFPDSLHTAVATDTNFGTLVSNHCAIGSSRLIAYQKSVYRNIAQLQTAAGLTPNLQFGEFLWWFLAGPGGMACYDSETLTAAQAALGRPLHVFSGPNDDPTVNGGADAIFLRNRLRDHVAVLIADIRSAYPTAVLELLWPCDVNHPTPVPDPPSFLGGQFNRFVNLPVEWQVKPGSGLDRIKVEALAFGSRMRNLDLAREAIELFPNFGWPLDSLRYLVPVFGVAAPWHRELALAYGAGIRTNNLWAFDHICLYNLDVPERALERRSIVQAADPDTPESQVSCKRCHHRRKLARGPAATT